jgi:hypothetical protein
MPGVNPTAAAQHLVVAAMEPADRAGAALHDLLATRTTDPTAQAASAPLPRSLDAWQLEAAARDPFVPYTPPAPAEPPPPSEPQQHKPVTSEPVPEPTPTAPPMDYRFLGRMLTPEGRPITLLARGDATIEVQPGQQLEDGYRVEAVSAQAIRLVYPSLGTVVDVNIPPAAAP